MVTSVICALTHDDDNAPETAKQASVNFLFKFGCPNKFSTGTRIVERLNRTVSPYPYAGTIRVRFKGFIT